MHASIRVFQVAAVVFVLTFSTLATAQRLIKGARVETVSAPVRRFEGIREIPVFFPQGRLYCANGSLAYQKLYPREWQRISADDAVRVATQAVDDACGGGDPVVCREYRARLTKLRLAIRGCF